MDPTEPLTEDIHAPKKEPRTTYHIDDWLDGDAIMSTIHDEGLRYAHFMFSYFRQPAWVKNIHSAYYKDRRLFVDYEGTTYRCTGASRLGDVWLAKDFNRVSGYDLRVNLDFKKLTHWRAEP